MHQSRCLTVTTSVPRELNELSSHVGCRGDCIASAHSTTAPPIGHRRVLRFSALPLSAATMINVNQEALETLRGREPGMREAGKRQAAPRYHVSMYIDHVYRATPLALPGRRACG